MQMNTNLSLEWQLPTLAKSNATTRSLFQTWQQGHRMPDGTVHPIQVGLRMVEEFRTRVRENIEADPLRAVAIAYEEELTRIKEQLGEGGDLEEFTALCPTLSAMEPSMYRYLIIFAMFMTMTICSWRSCCIPPTPPTQIEIDLDTRYV